MDDLLDEKVASKLHAIPEEAEENTVKNSLTYQNALEYQPMNDPLPIPQDIGLHVEHLDIESINDEQYGPIEPDQAPVTELNDAQAHAPVSSNAIGDLEFNNAPPQTFESGNVQARASSSISGSSHRSSGKPASFSS